MNLVHAPTFRLNTLLFLLFLVLAVVLWQDMPDRYPVHFDLAGNPTRWEERGPGMWILLVAIASLSFAKAHLLQRFLVADPNSTLLNVPYKRLFHALPMERKVPVVRRVNRLLGLVNTGMLLMFVSLLFLVYYSAHNPGSAAARAANHALLAMLLLVLVVPAAEYVALRRMIRRKLTEEGLLERTVQPGVGV